VGGAIFETFVLYADLVPVAENAPGPAIALRPQAWHPAQQEDAQIQQQQQQQQQ
jgi:hypothetical protein